MRVSSIFTLTQPSAGGVENFLMLFDHHLTLLYYHKLPCVELNLNITAVATLRLRLCCCCDNVRLLHMMLRKPKTITPFLSVAQKI